MTRSHRALILQGGGALGAYEAGAVVALVDKLVEEDKVGPHPSRPVFDLVAGSSIGAVNAVLLVNSVITGNANGSQADIWRKAAQTLEDFWTKIIPTHSVLDYPIVRSGMEYWWKALDLYRELSIVTWKNLAKPYEEEIERFRTSPPLLPWYFLGWPDNWPGLATGEGARRHSEYVNTLSFGAKGILAGAITQPPEMKFLNPFGSFLRFDNSPLLAMILEKYWSGGTPIHTAENQPRLLLVAVDVQNCSTAVTFDSYPKSDGKHSTVYGGEHEKHVIEYDGVIPDHLLASMSTHLRFKYPEMKTKDGKTRVFWDGAYLSNTPLREVIHSHREYWVQKPDKTVPDLEVFIVNLYPAIENTVPSEPDSIQDREVDIKFHDRTKYDLKAAEMTGDLVYLIKDILQKIDDSGNKEIKDQVKNLLKTKHPMSKKRNGENRTYEEVLEGRFSIVRRVYVERTDDEHTIYGKAFDFSYSTLASLVKQGESDASDAYDKEKKIH